LGIWKDFKFANEKAGGGKVIDFNGQRSNAVANSIEAKVESALTCKESET